MRIARKVRSSLTAAALVCGTFVGGVGVAAPASAAGAGCPSGSTAHWSDTFHDSAGRVAAIGYIYQYRTGGCAYLVAQGPYSGMYKWMDVEIKADGGGDVGYDGGHYYYYAGPVSASSATTGSLCMVIYFDMQNSAGNWVVHTTDGTPCD